MRIIAIVHTNAREEKIVEGKELHVYVKEPPVKGKANKKVIELIAKKFGVSKNDVKIVAGVTSRKKVIEVIKE